MKALYYLLSFSVILASVSAQSANNVATTAEECELDSSKENTVFDPIGDLSGHINKFLSDNIFNQVEGSSTDFFPSLTGNTAVAVGDSVNEFKGFSDFSDGVSKFFSDFGVETPKDDESNKLDQVLGNAIVGKASRSTNEVRKLFVDFFQESMEQLKNHFKDVSFEHLSAISVLYFIERMDEVKNPSWKRRKHRYHKQVPIDSIIELHNALYLAQLAYAGSVDVIEAGLHDFLNNTHKLIYATTEGLPGEPGHFIAIRKETGKNKKGLLSKLGLKKEEDKPLEVVMAVRGTKELGDILSDTLLDAADFKDGTAHSGVSKSGAWLAAEHLEMLRSLLDASNRKKLKLTLIGHSLGAGAAAIAAMYFNDEDWIDATSIGFGCPALLDLAQSVAVKDYVVTVVTDSDIVPRLSGAVMVNTFLDISSYDWTAKALEDLELVLDWSKLPNKEGILKWADSTMSKNDRPFFDEVTKSRVEQVLYPPGTCIHVYRDGVGFAATYTPCFFFDTIDLSRTMIDDHMIPTGYHKAFLDLLRYNRNDLRADFQHDIMGLKV